MGLTQTTVLLQRCPRVIGMTKTITSLETMSLTIMLKTSKAPCQSKAPRQVPILQTSKRWMRTKRQPQLFLAVSPFTCNGNVSPLAVGSGTAETGGGSNSEFDRAILIQL